jgi:hypothetical protein
LKESGLLGQNRIAIIQVYLPPCRQVHANGKPKWPDNADQAEFMGLTGH